MSTFKVILQWIILVILLSSNIKSEAQWSTLKEYGNSFKSCYAINNDTFFVSGKNGFILRTLNSGVSWDSAQTIYTTSYFNDIHFPTKNVGYACGGGPYSRNKSAIIKTTNSGFTWDTITSNKYGLEFYKIFFVNESLGYVGGEKLLKTIDGGKTFEIISLPFASKRISAIYFFNKDTGIIATHDFDISANSVFRIAKTSDGGINWVITFIDSTNSNLMVGRINDVYFKNSLIGNAVGNLGKILSSNDGGNSWSSSQPKNITHINDIWLSKNSHLGYFIGSIKDSLGTSGVIFKTIDAGKTWIQDFRGNLTNMSMIDEGFGYAINSSTIYKTNNGGIASNKNITYGQHKLSIYPNPSSGTFNISFDGIESVSVFDGLGKLIITDNQIQNNNKIKIDLTQNPEGIYIIKTIYNGNIYTNKILKK